VVVALVTLLVFSASGRIARVLGTTGINIMTRLMGLILAALAVQHVGHLGLALHLLVQGVQPLSDEGLRRSYLQQSLSEHADLLQAWVRSARAAGLPREAASAVIMNPPYWSPGEVRVTPKAAKADAHVLAEGGLDAWVRVATSLVRPRGLLAIVFRADRLTDLLAALQGRFGDAGIVPLHPRPGEAAIRVVVTAIKGPWTPPCALWCGCSAAPHRGRRPAHKGKSCEREPGNGPQTARLASLSIVLSRRSTHSVVRSARRARRAGRRPVG
jgi:hypothetical protein